MGHKNMNVFSTYVYNGTCYPGGHYWDHTLILVPYIQVKPLQLIWRSVYLFVYCQNCGKLVNRFSFNFHDGSGKGQYENIRNHFGVDSFTPGWTVLHFSLKLGAADVCALSVLLVSL